MVENTLHSVVAFEHLGTTIDLVDDAFDMFVESVALVVVAFDTSVVDMVDVVEELGTNCFVVDDAVDTKLPSDLLIYPSAKVNSSVISISSLFVIAFLNPFTVVIRLLLTLPNAIESFDIYVLI